MTVFDYDVLTDDMAGQVFAMLNYVPGLNTEIPATFSGIEQVLLPIIHPTPDGKHFDSKYKRWPLLDLYEEQFRTDRAIQYK